MIKGILLSGFAETVLLASFLCFQSSTAGAAAGIDDGIPASWRQQYFGAAYQTDPRVMANADPDNDGANNLEEYLAETNPMDPQSVLKILSIHSVPVVVWNSVSNVVYHIMRKDNINSTNWTAVGSVQANASITSFTDYSATNSKSFYWISPKP